jgi:imidazolonepropionase-like amidohydrolase
VNRLTNWIKQHQVMASFKTALATLEKLVLLSVLLGSAACGGQALPHDTPASSGPVVITNGTILDGRGSEPVRDGIVAIAGARITFVGRAADYSFPSHAQVIDARGGTILPGIIDAHVHGTSAPALRRQFLVSGVTSVCDLGLSLEDMPQFDEDTVDQDPVARGFRAGPILTAPGGLPGAVLGRGLNYEVKTPHEAREAVVDLYKRGADFIKVYLQREDGGAEYPMLTEQQLAAIVDEAHSLGLLVRAHVSYASLLNMAVQAGVDIIEHVPANATELEAQSLSESQWQTLLESNDPLPVYFTELYPQYEAQLERMVEAGIVMVPTLGSYMDLYRESTPTPQDEAGIKIVLEIVRSFHELGGVVALGTDFIIGKGKQAGMPLGEMKMLLAAGLTPMEVIEAGTRQSAIVCGHGDELGTLEPGKLADLIVVDGDPLQDMQAMSRVVLVIKNGEIAVISEEMIYTDQ